jgi:hypothetical protein
MEKAKAENYVVGLQGERLMQEISQSERNAVKLKHRII